MGSSWNEKIDAARQKQQTMLGGTPARMFTRRHHKFLAESINQTAVDMLDDTSETSETRSTAAYVIRGVVEKLATQLRYDNESFDRDGFVESCLRGWW